MLRESTRRTGSPQATARLIALGALIGGDANIASA
jgi:hypothetical protein